jgi:hypothetical protein
MIELPEAHPSKSFVFYHFCIVVIFAWSVVYAVMMIVLQSMKLYYYPGPKSEAGWALGSIFLWFIFALGKFDLGRAGNRSEYVPAMVCAAILAAFCIVLEVYLLVLQLYLWSWEFPLHIISIALDGISLILSVVLIIIFAIK